MANPYSYTDKASDFVQEASTLQATVTKQDADDVSIPVSHIDGRCRSLLCSLGDQATVRISTRKLELYDRLRGGQTSHFFASKVGLLWK